MKAIALVALVVFCATCGIVSARANVPEMTVIAIEHYLAATLDVNCSDDPDGPSSGRDMPITSPGPISITSIGSAEYIVQGQFGCCSATGNCGFWVLESSGHTFRVLLEGVGTGVIPSHSFSHGHRDLEVTIIDSMTSGMTVTYQFDGRKYRESKCTYTDSENGNKSACHL